MKMLCTVKLSPHRYKTPEGYLYCKDAIIARTGKQTYLKSEIYENCDDNEYIDVDRSEKEVFDEKTMASFEKKPLTIEHPSVSVGPENYKDLAVGHIENVRRGEYEGQPVMLADIIVNDQEAIDLIETGEMEELSCGYDCDITDGPNPEQINIRGNHVALCEAGRAGIARIVDSWGTQSLEDTFIDDYRVTDPKELEQIDKENYVIGSNGMWFAKDKSEKELLTKAYCSGNQGKDWYTCGLYTKSANPKDKGNRTQTGKYIFQTPPNAGRQTRIGRNVLTWYAANGIHQVDYNLEIDHIDEDYTNDRLDNLQRITHGENVAKTKAKNKVGDSIQKGSLIQEFGKQGKQYKITKINGNVIYAESLTTGNIVLFKKDEENIEWATISKSEVKDSKLDLHEVVKSSIHHLKSDLGKEDISADDVMEDIEKNYEGYEDIADTPEHASQWYNLIEAEFNKLTQNRKVKDTEWSSWDIIISTDRSWYCTLNEVKDKIHDKYGLPFNQKEVSKKAEEGELMLQCIPLKYGNVGESEIKKMSIGPFMTKKEAEDFINSELTQMLSELGGKEEFDINVEEQHHSLHDSKIKDYDCLQRYKELKAKLKKEGTLSEDELEEYYYCKGTMESIIGERNELNGLKPGDEEYEYLDSEPKLGLYVNGKFVEPREDAWKMAKKLLKEDNLAEFYEYWVDEFGYPHETDLRNTVKRIISKDSKFNNNKYVICLEPEQGKSTWLDENDNPTSDYSKAKRFASYEEADSHRKTYCNGSVAKVKDSINDSFKPKEEIPNIEKLLSGIKHGNIEESWGSLTIDFDSRSELKKAGKILVKLYDIELYYDDPEDMYIAVYDKFDKEKEIYLNEDSIKDAKDTWGSYDLYRGKESEEFKKYLRDRGFYFEPSENGRYVHFEVKNADKYVTQRAEDIRKHFAQFRDSYSRKFYIKAIDALEKQLKKLERNELLDSNQEDYEKQKNNLKQSIESQIEEYKEKLKDL